MSDLDFNFENEMARMRGGSAQKEKPKQPPKQKPNPNTNQNPNQEAKPRDTHKTNVAGKSHNVVNGNDNTSQKPVQAGTAPTEPEGFEVKQSHQETPGAGGQANKKKHDPIGWRQFKTLPGIFEHVGGDRPVRLNPKIRKSQVSGMPEPMFGVIQEHLKEKFLGAVVDFPWGEYKVTEKNRVFTAKASLVRYLMFDSFRDSDGTHVQYAKQWMVLQHPVFDEGFNPDTHLSPTSDELDIYVLLFVAHSAEEYFEPKSQSSNTEQNYQTAERLGMLNMSMTRVMDKLNEQEKMVNAHMERTNMVQTVLLLDRMGLLKGGLPRDMGDFVRVLEQNREALGQTGTVVDNHIVAEEERKKTLARQERLKQMQAQRGGAR